MFQSFSRGRACPFLREAVQVIDKYTDQFRDHGLSEVYRAQGRKEAPSRLMNGIRHFEASDPPSDEATIWEREASDLDIQGDSDEDENSPINEEHGDVGEKVALNRIADQ